MASINLKISACIVVYNEEKLIERCLASIAGFCDEIILVQDGPCDDRTLDIAKKYTQKIYVCTRIGEAELHRVFAYKEASYDWILKIDADEYLTEESKNIIKAELSSKSQADGYSLVWPLWNGSKYISSRWPYKPCLFRKDKMHFIAFPHSEETVDGKMKKISARLEHQPDYNNLSFGSFLKKHKEWILIHKDFLAKDIYSLDSFNPPELRSWPLHMELIRKYKLFSIPMNFLVFLFGYFFRKEVLFNFNGILKSFILNYAYYVCLAIEYSKCKISAEK